MKTIAQPHSFSFGKEEDFVEKYTQLFLADQHDKYQESKASYTTADIELYQTSKQKLDQWQTTKLQFMVKVKNGKAAPEDFAQQQENDTAIQSITLDEKLGKFIDLDEKVRTSCHHAASVRRAYIQEYNPEGRTIELVWGQNAPDRFHNLATILKADGATIKDSRKEEKYEPGQDIAYISSEICGRNDGKDTWPILYHAEKNDCYTLFFLNFRPLTEHCRDDSELKKARELKQQGKKIMIITSESYGGYYPQRFL